MLKVIIASGKDFSDQHMLNERLDYYLQSKQPDIEIVTGFSLASDALAVAYAEARGYPVKHFPGGFRHMPAMIKYSNAAIVFHDRVSKGAGQLIADCREANLNVKVVPYAPVTKVTNPLDFSVKSPIRTRKPKTIVIEGETLTPDTKPKRKAPAKTGQVVYRHDYRAIYLAAHEQWFKSEYPNAHKDGHMPDKKVPAVDTANGMASYIIDHAAWTGNFANRINVQGRQIGGFTRTQSGQVFDDRKFIKAATKKGTEDVDCIFNGVTVKLEIKIGSDRQSEDQKKQEARVKKAGGHYFLVRSIDDYIDIYLRFSVKQTSIFDNLV